MTSRVTERTLHDMFPDYESEMLHEIYEAHDRDFDETVRVIQENCSGKSTITMADVLKKRKTLIDELQKESRYQTSKHNQLVLTNYQLVTRSSYFYGSLVNLFLFIGNSGRS